MDGVAPGVATRLVCKGCCGAVATPDVIEARVTALGPVEGKERESVNSPTDTGVGVIAADGGAVV
jgi:hypothetical protein